MTLQVLMLSFVCDLTVGNHLAVAQTTTSAGMVGSALNSDFRYWLISVYSDVVIKRSDLLYHTVS